MLRRRQSNRHTHVADRQMTEAATEGREESDELLLRPCIFTQIHPYPRQAETHIC